jgi:hypothetical protein
MSQKSFQAAPGQIISGRWQPGKANGVAGAGSCSTSGCISDKTGEALRRPKQRHLICHEICALQMVRPLACATNHLVPGCDRESDVSPVAIGSPRPAGNIAIAPIARPPAPASIADAVPMHLSAAPVCGRSRRGRPRRAEPARGISIPRPG